MLNALSNALLRSTIRTPINFLVSIASYKWFENRMPKVSVECNLLFLPLVHSQFVFCERNSSNWLQEAT